jgi:hypothetical protein
MLKYAAIYTDRITPQYIELIRTTGVNSYSDSFLRTKHLHNNARGKLPTRFEANS